MNYLNRIIHDDLDLLKKKKIQLNKPFSLEQKTECKVIFIGISGGQASGKSKISEYFKNHIENSAIINEMSFFKLGDKENIQKEEEYLIKDYDFYSKERRLYLIDRCIPEAYDYDKFYEVLITLKSGKAVKVPYFDEKECKYIHEKDKIIDPENTPLIIIEGYFIFKNQKIRELLNLKIYKEVEEDYVRLSRLVLREEKYLKNNVEAYEIFFAIYERFYKTSYDENINTYKKLANILLPDYKITEDDEVEGEDTLEFLLFNLKNLVKKKK